MPRESLAIGTETTVYWNTFPPVDSVLALLLCYRRYTVNLGIVFWTSSFIVIYFFGLSFDESLSISLFTSLFKLAQESIRLSSLILSPEECWHLAHCSFGWSLGDLLSSVLGILSLVSWTIDFSSSLPPLRIVFWKPCSVSRFYSLILVKN